MCSSRKSSSSLALGNFGTLLFAGVAPRFLATFLAATFPLVCFLAFFCLAGDFFAVCFFKAFFFASFFFGTVHTS